MRTHTNTVNKTYFQKVPSVWFLAQIPPVPGRPMFAIPEFKKIETKWFRRLLTQYSHVKGLAREQNCQTSRIGSFLDRKRLKSVIDCANQAITTLMRSFDEN